ncbi:MAG: AraC family transcriptional regulator [Actinomycetota bacterium]
MGPSADNLETKDFGIPLYVGHAVLPEPMVSADLHRHPHREVVIALGTATLTTDFEAVVVEGPAFVSVEAGQLHRWSSDGDLELWVIGHRPGSLTTADERHHPAFRSGVVHPIPAEEVDDLVGLLTLARRRFEESPEGSAVVTSLVNGVLTQLGQWSTSTGSMQDELVEAFLQAIEARVGTRPAVRDIAGDLGVSAAHLTSITKAQLGMSPKRLVLDRELTEAKRLLTHSHDSAASIGRRLGFGDASEFGRWFKTHVGSTPAGFRRSPRADGGSGAPSPLSESTPQADEGQP